MRRAGKWLRCGRSPACPPEPWRGRDRAAVPTKGLPGDARGQARVARELAPLCQSANFALILLSVLPPVLLLFALLRWHVEVPYLDQWELVPLLEKFDAGELSFADLWAQHNEHRILLPKLIMLGLAAVTNWDTRYELAVSFVLASLLFVLLVIMVWRSVSSGRNWAASGAILLLSILVFSLNQWENWFLGWQLQVFLAAVCAVGCLYCLVRAPGRPIWLMGAILLALAASCSFGTGVLMWPVGFLLILLLREGPRRRLLTVWGLATALCLVVYFNGLDTGINVSHGIAKPRPSVYPAYVLKYLGAPVINWDGGRAPLLDLDGALAAVAGGVGLCVWAFLVWRMWRERSVNTVFWLSVGVFAIACAALTAFARAGDPMGSEQATSSRYITLASFLWYSIAGLSIETSPGEVLTNRTRLVACLVLSVFAVAAGVHGAYTWTLRYPAYREAAQTLVDGRGDAPLRYLYPKPEELGRRAEFLKEHRLSVFADSP